MAQLHQIDCTTQFWTELESFSDRTICQEWVQFIADTQKAQPVAAELRDGSSVLGYFSALVFSRFGIRILGSPFPGWTTGYMGFALAPGVPRWMALAALERFAFRELGCLHFEIVDRYLTVEDGKRVGLPYSMTTSYETDLRESEEELFNRMKSACRRCIRKAAREGVVIEEARDDAFAGEYYEQLKEVFLRQRLVPTYDLERVRKLIEHLGPTGRLLLLRARDPDGRCIATGIYPAINRIAHFWGNASLMTGRHLRPNEAVHWYAIRYWRRRGVAFFDWGGAGRYKEKYGCYPIALPRFYKSRIPELGYLRNHAERLISSRQRVAGWLRSRVLSRATS
jgi:Acetyltransferase (GNAT) domain